MLYVQYTYWCTATAVHVQYFIQHDIKQQRRMGMGSRRYISPSVSRGAPGVFCTYFYSHVRRLRLENYYT